MVHDYTLLSAAEIHRTKSARCTGLLLCVFLILFPSYRSHFTYSQNILGGKDTN